MEDYIIIAITSSITVGICIYCGSSKWFGRLMNYIQQSLGREVWERKKRKK